jgi:hypothetical protein
MNFIDGINILFSAYTASLKKLSKPAIWGPFLVYFLLQVILLIILVNHIKPFLHPLTEPFLSLFDEERAEIFNHYPGLFLILPYIFQWFKIALGVVFEGLVAGLTVFLFSKYYGIIGDQTKSISYVFKRWHQLYLCWLIIAGLLFVVNWYIPLIFEDTLYRSPRMQIAFGVLMNLVTIFLYSLFVYALPAIIVKNINFFRALKMSLRRFLKYPIFTFCLTGIAMFFTMVMSYFSGQSGTIVDKFAPELVLYLLLAGLIVDLLVNIILTGTVVRLLQDDSN